MLRAFSFEERPLAVEGKPSACRLQGLPPHLIYAARYVPVGDGPEHAEYRGIAAGSVEPFARAKRASLCPKQLALTPDSET